MSLALGELVGRVVIESAAAEAKITSLMRLFRDLGSKAETATAGAATLDRELVGVATAATKAAEGLDRTSAAARTTASTEDRAAAAATAQARSLARLSGAMEPLASATARERQAQLRLIAAQERLNALQVSGTATTRQLASAQGSLIGAQQGVLAAQKRAEAASAASAQRMVAVGTKMSHAITLPVLIASGLAIKSAMDFEQATNVYVTAAGESEKNLGVIRDGIKKTAVETGTSIKNLTDAEYLVEKAGVRGAKGLLILNAAAKGAREENAELSDVVQAMTSVMASYHLPAERAVQVMNALKTGAGQAKVTMEDFSRSLSTVIPIASANKISIQEVFGAYATLTQHGTTAAESTQELNATIRNLAKPNRVAMTEMQALGLSVTDVTKNIGKRGLTGTIDLLVNAITQHMGPAGLVLQKAFNQSKSAGQDVQIMIDKMPPSLAKLANTYLQGKINLADWRDTLKGLPPLQAALLQQFAVMANKANGFNSTLRVGDPAAKTFTAALGKVSGGAIGLNTILQLSGENMAGFKTRTDAVGKSLNDTSKDVEGWASTAKLSATHTAQFKQELHVLAIDAGAHLLPMFDGLVKHLESAVHWFGDLSHGQKEILGWSVGVLAAIGPVIAIGGRLALLGRGISTFVAGTTTRLATMAGATEASALRISTAMARISGALGGAAIGVAIGSLTQHSSDGVKAIGALSSAAAGAAFGSAGGPLGAAIGGAAGLVGNLATQFLGAGHAADTGAARAKAALERQNAAADDLLTTLKSVNGAYNDQYREQTINQLQKNGALDNADAAGVAPKTITSAALGDTAAIAALAKRSRDLLAGVTKGGVTTYDTKAQAALQGILNALAEVSPAARRAEHDYELFLAAEGRGVISGKMLAGGLKNLTAELKGTGVALTTSANAEQAHSAFAARNTEVIKENVNALAAVAAKHVQAGQSAITAAGGFYKGEDALRKQLIALHFDAAAVDKLIASYHSLPKNVVTALKKTGVTGQEIDAIYTKYHRIPKGWITQVTKKGVTPEQIQAITDKWLGLRKHPTANLTVHSNIPALLTDLGTLYNAILHPPKPPAVNGPSIPGVTVPGIIGPPRAAGGDIIGPGPRGVDSVLTPSAPGEWMATTTGADLLRRMFGPAGMAQINLGRVPAIAKPSVATSSGMGVRAVPSLHAGNIAGALHGMRIVIDAGSVGTLTGFVDSRVDGTLGRASRTPAARQSRADSFGRT